MSINKLFDFLMRIFVVFTLYIVNLNVYATEQNPSFKVYKLGAVAILRKNLYESVASYAVFSLGSTETKHQITDATVYMRFFYPAGINSGSQQMPAMKSTCLGDFQPAHRTEKGGEMEPLGHVSLKCQGFNFGFTMLKEPIAADKFAETSDSEREKYFRASNIITAYIFMGHQGIIAFDDWSKVGDVDLQLSTLVDALTSYAKKEAESNR